jgi:hypothetical protein
VIRSTRRTKARVSFAPKLSGLRVTEPGRESHNRSGPGVLGRASRARARLTGLIRSPTADTTMDETLPAATRSKDQEVRNVTPRIAAVAIAGFLLGGSVVGCTSDDQTTDPRSFVEPSLTALMLDSIAVDADGTTQIRIAATTPVPPAGLRVVITFKTSGGRFDVGDGRLDTLVRVAANELGIATALLQAPSVPQTARITAAVGVSIRDTLVRFRPVTSAITNVILQQDSLAADGASSMLVTAAVTASAIGDRRKVVFSTTSGTIVGTVAAIPGAAPTTSVTVDADATGIARAILRASRDVGDIVVQAVSGGPSSPAFQRILRLVPAFPTRLDLETSQLTLKRDLNASLVVTATLRRDIGQVSSNTEIQFAAEKVDGGSIGQFGPVSKVSDVGLASVGYALLDSTYKGPVVVTARVNGTSPIVSGRTVFNVVP